MGGMGLVPRSSWKDLGLASCINCMKRSSNLKGFRFRVKLPKFE
jgi:hypothetical protein